MVKLATKNSESLPENIEGHSAAGWGIVGFVYIILQTAGPSMQSLKPVRSGNGQPLIALRCLLLMPISTPLRIVNRCCSVLVSCKRRYTFNLYRINKYKNFKKKLLRNVPVSRIHCSATRLTFVSIVANGTRMKFGRIVPQVNMHALRESDFRIDVTFSRRQP